MANTMKSSSKVSEFSFSSACPPTLLNFPRLHSDYLVDLKIVFDELSMGQIVNKVEMDSQFSNDLEKAEEIHRLKEEKNGKRGIKVLCHVRVTERLMSSRCCFDRTRSSIDSQIHRFD